MEEKRQTALSLDDHELLLKLASQQKTATLHRRITMYVEILILVLILAAILVIGPKLLTITTDLGNTLERVNNLLDTAEPAVNNMSNIEFDTLNKAIESIGTSAEQFAAFTSKLSSIGGLFR